MKPCSLTVSSGQAYPCSVFPATCLSSLHLRRSCERFQNLPRESVPVLNHWGRKNIAETKPRPLHLTYQLLLFMRLKCGLKFQNNVSNIDCVTRTHPKYRHKEKNLSTLKFSQCRYKIASIAVNHFLYIPRFGPREGWQSSAGISTFKRKKMGIFQPQEKDRSGPWPDSISRQPWWSECLVCTLTESSTHRELCNQNYNMQKWHFWH